VDGDAQTEGGDSGTVNQTSGTWFGRRRSDSATGRWAPYGLLFFQNSQNRFKYVNSKQIPSIAPKVPKFCMTLDWSIVNNFLNCSDFKFPT
jgi:hypothetical protein